MKAATLILTLFLNFSAFAQQDSSVRDNDFNALGLYAGFGLKSNTESTPWLFNAEYTKVKKLMGMGFGLGCGSLQAKYGQTADKKADSTRKLTYFPLYGSVKLFTRASVYLSCDLGLALSGDHAYHSGNSTVFGLSFGFYPYNRIAIPLSFRFGYQRTMLAAKDNVYNVNAEAYTFSFGLLIK